MIFGAKKRIEAELNGAYEERGVIGTRIEIEGKNITILWRNAPVLETTFDPEETDGGYLLHLAENGLRNGGDPRVYATVTRVFVHNGTMEFDEEFPISGPSKNRLEKTTLTRYGNVTFCDELLPELEGTWKDAKGGDFWTFVFRGDEMTMPDGSKTRVRIVRPNGYSNGALRIIDADPAVYEWRGFGNMTYEGGRIRFQMMICDAPSPVIELVRA